LDLFTRFDYYFAVLLRTAVHSVLVFKVQVICQVAMPLFTVGWCLIISTYC